MTEVTNEMLDSLCNALNEQAVAKGWTAPHSPHIHTFMRMKKYARIVKDHAAFCFIDLATGNILKSESWKRPAPQKRGTIHTPTLGLEYLTQHGAHYLYR